MKEAYQLAENPNLRPSPRRYVEIGTVPIHHLPDQLFYGGHRLAFLTVMFKTRQSAGLLLLLPTLGSHYYRLLRSLRYYIIV